jgi:hypothetical protein
MNLATADIGRHITNGDLLLNGITDVLYENYYSFTEPTHPFTNHHWASGVLFHVINAAIGFAGLSLIYILLSVACMLIMVRATAQGSPVHWALLFAMLTVPLFAYRVEVRPEGFSYLLLAMYFMILSKYRSDALKFPSMVMCLVLLQLLWVNLHIFFFLGIGITGVFLVDAIINNADKLKVRNLSFLILILTITSLVNPHFHNGLLAPFTIFNSYGYMVIENQTVFFLQERFGNPQFIHLEIFGMLVVMVTIWAIATNVWRHMVVEMIMAIGFLILSLMAVRGIPLFAMFFIPLMSRSAQLYFERTHFKTRERISGVVPYFGIVFCILFIPMKGTYASANKGYNEIGAFDGVEASGKFLQRAEIPGRIFNNYDIGSYLIYFLKEGQRVFVDNRPEAYSVAFFDSTYIPMQENDDFFKKKVLEYDLNVICFYRHDATPWGQPFLIRRTQDSDWVPIFVDDVSLILIRNTAANAPWITKYALPREMFQSVPN